MTSLEPGDDDLHDPDDPTLHAWWPPGPPDGPGDAAWIARVTEHDRAHAERRASKPTDEVGHDGEDHDEQHERADLHHVRGYGHGRTGGR